MRTFGRRGRWVVGVVVGVARRAFPRLFSPCVLTHPPPPPFQTMGGEFEVVEQFGLSFKSLGEALTRVSEALGLAPCEGTGVVKGGAQKHSAYLSGVFVGGIKVLGRCQLWIEGDGCVLKLGLRTEAEGVAELLMSTLS